MAGPGGFNSKGQMYMMIIAVIISGIVAIFIARKIWYIWKRGKFVQKRAEEEALLQ